MADLAWPQNLKQKQLPYFFQLFMSFSEYLNFKKTQQQILMSRYDQKVISELFSPYLIFKISQIYFFFIFL